MTETEQKIIRKAAAGDRLAFRELVLEHSHAMFRLAWRLTCDESTASGGMHKSGFIGNTVNATGIHRRHASIAMVTGRSTDLTGLQSAHKIGVLDGRPADLNEFESCAQNRLHMVQ